MRECGKQELKNISGRFGKTLPYADGQFEKNFFFGKTLKVEKKSQSSFRTSLFPFFSIMHFFGFLTYLMEKKTTWIDFCVTDVLQTIQQSFKSHSVQDLIS